MMAELTTYSFEQEAVRVVQIDDAPWFVAGDLAKILGYGQAAFMTRSLDEDEKGLHVVQTPGGQQEMNIISESGMYAAVIKSRRPEALRFRKWVTAEVLPAIRRTGRYELAGAEPPPELAVAVDVPTVSTAINLVREARRLFGAHAARQVWIELGLPAPIVDAAPSIEADPAYPLVKAFLDGRTFVTTTAVVDAIGLNPDNLGDRKRTIAAVKLAGFMPWTKRVAGEPTKGWKRRDGTEA